MVSRIVTEADLAEVARTRADMTAGAVDDVREEVARVEDLDADGVRCRLYQPADTAGVLLFLHGGGFVYGDLDTHDAHCRRLVDRTGWSVLAVHYRRAPEDPFPAAVEDAETVASWVATRPPALGAPGQLAISGDSAGANLALGVSLRHPDLFTAQVLVYPFLDPSGDSYDRTIPDPDFGVDDLLWFWRLYVGPGDPDSVILDPLRAPSFRGLPRTLLQLAALDVLTSTGRRLTERLTTDDVTVEEVTYPGVGHGFWRHDDNDQHEPAMADLARFLAG
jgi:acetyl esterase